MKLKVFKFNKTHFVIRQKYKNKDDCTNPPGMK